MAIFYPSKISESIRKDNKFSAEVKVYDSLWKELRNKDAYVYYSCSFVQNNYEPGESDFIIVLPNHGIAFIEVKGGGIEYQDDIDQWYSINRNNQKFAVNINNTS